MRSWLASLAFLAVSFPAVAQTPCLRPGVTIDVSPSIAAPGELVAVTVRNASSQDVGLPSSCTWIEVHPDSTCSSPAVAGTACLFYWVTIPPGHSWTQYWDQHDDHGVQVPDGSYSFTVWISDVTMVTCCAPLTITSACPAASAVPRNGSGANPQTLASVSPPRLGESWKTRLDCTGHASSQALLLLYDSPASGRLTPYGELLVRGARLSRIALPHVGSPVGFSQPIPLDVALCGLHASSQGLCLGAPGPQLSNALDLLVGI